MKFFDKESYSAGGIGDIFADFFASIYSNAAYNDTNLYPYSLTSAEDIYFPTYRDCHIFWNLKSLTISFRPGPDVVPSCILNRCAWSFITPLIILFNTSINYGYFPAF